MLRQTLLILIGILMIGGADKVFAQTRITLETKSFPKGFKGHDPKILFDNLNSLLQQNKANGKTVKAVREMLKGKLIYENLTTDDLFAFSSNAAANYVSGNTAENDKQYRGAIFPLRNLKDSPPPLLYVYRDSGFGDGRGTGIGGDPKISSRDDLVSEFKGALPLETLWTLIYLPLKTIYSPEALAGRDFNVPSPQIHYGLSFIKQQSFSLVNVTDKRFSIKKNDFDYQNGAGIAAWMEDGEHYGGKYNEPIFIVKLSMPYLKSDYFQTPDAVRKKTHRAVRNIIYAELVAIWIYDKRDGTIVSKSNDEPRTPNAAAEKDNSAEQRIERTIFKIPPTFLLETLPSKPLEVLSRPRPDYTDAARNNYIQGVVKLSVVFLASGKIGEIKVVSGLPDGLNERTIEAAQRIVFSPVVKNGVPTTVTKILVYPFTIY